MQTGLIRSVELACFPSYRLTVSDSTKPTTRPRHEDDIQVHFNAITGDSDRQCFTKIIVKCIGFVHFTKKTRVFAFSPSNITNYLYALSLHNAFRI